MKKINLGVILSISVIFCCYSAIVAPRKRIKDESPLKNDLKRLSKGLFKLKRLLQPYQKYTQTQALLSIASIKKEVYKRYPILRTEAGDQFLKNTLRLEEKYKDTHWVFYHAFTKAWIVPQDLMIGLTKGLRPLTSDLAKFRFLRWQEYEKQTVSEFLMKEISSEGLINDNTPQHRASLLSVNLALFGNVDFPGESTFDYFLKPMSHATVNPAVIEDILSAFGAPQHYVKDLLELDEKYLSPEKALNQEPKEQVLLQIFIPKKIVDDVGYVAWVQGVPYERELVAMVDNLARYELSKKPGFSHGTQPVLERIKELFKREKEKNTLYAKVIKHIKKGKFKISAFLHKYTNEPATIPGIANVQARLLFTNELLLNPSADIIFYKHDLIPKENKIAYRKAMNTIINNIIVEKLQGNAPKKKGLVTREAPI